MEQRRRRGVSPSHLHLLPPDAVLELQKLCDGCPSYPTADALLLIERELGAPAAQLFDGLDAAVPRAQLAAPLAGHGLQRLGREARQPRLGRAARGRGRRRGALLVHLRPEPRGQPFGARGRRASA